MSEYMPEDMSDRMPEDMSDYICQKICQIECQKICQIECQKICQIICQKICQIECQIECQKICQIECQKDLPARKCINVMVGITRSKVILNSCFDRFWWLWFIGSVLNPLARHLVFLPLADGMAAMEPPHKKVALPQPWAVVQLSSAGQFLSWGLLSTVLETRR